MTTDGNELFIKSGAFKIPAGTKPAATLEKASARAVRANLIFKTSDGILSLIGLILAIGGTVAQAVNSWETTPSVPWIVGAGVAQIVGLLLVFFRGVWNLTPS